MFLFDVPITDFLCLRFLLWLEVVPSPKTVDVPFILTNDMKGQFRVNHYFKEPLPPKYLPILKLVQWALPSECNSLEGISDAR